MLRALHQPRAQTRVAQPRPAELVLRPDRGRRDRRQPPAAPRPCRRREAGAPRRLQGIHIHRLARFRRRVRAVLATATAGLTHPTQCSPRARSPRLFGLVHERLQQPGCDSPYRPSQSSPTARTTRPSTCEARLRHTMPGRTSSRHSPSTRCRWAARPYRPTRPRRRGTAAAAHSPQTRRRPASHAPNPPDTAVAGRRTDQPRAGARTPSACSRPAAARRFPPAPGSDPQPRRPCPARPPPARTGAGAPAPGPHHRGRLDPQAARRDLPPPSRTTLGSSSRAATGPAPSRKSTRFTDAIGDLPEAADTCEPPVQHVAQAGEVVRRIRET